MIMYTTRWLLAALVSVSFWSAAASSEPGQWQKYIDDTIEAFVDGDYVGAGRSFDAAVKRAEAFGPQDPRLATNLNGLAETYRAQGRYAEAEPLYKRSLAIHGP